MACIVSDEKLAHVHIFAPLYVMCPSFLLQLLLKFSLYNYFFDVPCYSFIHTSHIWGSFNFLYFGVCTSDQIWKIFNHYFFRSFPSPPSGTPVSVLDHLSISHCSLNALQVFHILLPCLFGWLQLLFSLQVC